jgi:hypothetical protein
LCDANLAPTEYVLATPSSHTLAMTAASALAVELMASRRRSPQVWQKREPSRNSLLQRGQVSAIAGTAWRTMISSAASGEGGRQNSC